MHALICRQSRKLGFASDSALGDGSLPALHDESLVSISVPARKNFPPAICYKSKRIYLQRTVRILNSYDIVIKQPEKSPVHSSYNTREAFVMRCRQTVTTKHIVRGFAEFVRLVTNKCHASNRKRNGIFEPVQEIFWRIIQYHIYLPSSKFSYFIVCKRTAISLL